MISIKIMPILLVSVAAVLVLFSGVISIPDASATHLTDDMTWQLVMVSSHTTCSNYHYQMTNKYTIITEKYLDLYQVENSNYRSLCLSQKQFQDEYIPEKDIDLMIVVYDKNLGEELLNSNKIGGVYTHSGKNKDVNHIIIICDCPNFYYSDPVWILTHELSHHVLYYKGYDFDVVEELVHIYDEKYDQCRESYDESCQDIALKLRVEPMAYSFSVMPPYYSAIGNSAIHTSNTDLNPTVEKFGKIITRWWTDGKISEGDYANALGLLAVENQKLADKNYEVLFKDEPLSDQETWQDVILADGSTENSKKVISSIREKMKNEEQTYIENDLSGLPDWFETNAQWWLDDKITTKDFVKGIKYLRDSGILQPH